MVRYVVAFGRLSRESGRKVETDRVDAKPEMDSRRSGLVRALPPAEERYRAHLKTIEERRGELARLESDLAALRDAVTGFEAIAQSRLGDLFAQLRRLEGETGDYSHRLARLRAALDALELDEMDEEELEDEEELLADAAFAAASGRSRPRGPHVPAATRRWMATEAAEAKRLYIDLAKRLHPDLARDDEERQRRERIMQRVNEAFHLRDLAGLRAIHLESIADDPKWAERPVSDRLAWAEAELERLEAALKETRLALARLRSGELFRLYLRYESGDPVFADLQKRVEERIANETRRLEKMQVAYRRLVDRWRLAGAASS